MPRPGYAVVYVILLCALAKRGSEGKRWKPEEFYRDHAALSMSLHLDGKKAEQAWKHCRKELIERNNNIEDLNMHLLEGSDDKRSTLSIEKDIHKATKFLPPHMKQYFLDCITNRNPPTPVSEEQGHSLRKHHVSIFGFIGGHRYLLSKPSPSPVSVSSAKSPSPTPKLPYEDLPLFVPSPQPPPSPLHHVFDPIHDNKQKKPIIFASIASGIIILIGLLLCYREVRKSKKVERDDRPLLILSSSDLSGGMSMFSSQRSIGMENSDMKESGTSYRKNPSIRTLSIKTEDNNASLVETTSSSSDGKGQVPNSLLQPPPGRSAPEPPPPPPPALEPRPPPPPPRVSRPPPAPPKPVAGRNQDSPLGPLHSSDGGESDAPKPKLKPFFWDKVVANPDQAMVWHEISAGSFQFSEEKIESLFGCANPNRNERRKESPSLEPSIQCIQIIDPKKAQNLSILLRALNVTTEEVIDALKEGNEIPVELIQTVLKMAPTTDEELKLRLFTGDVTQISPAEGFLKALVDIPFAFKRLESLMFMFTLPEEASSIKECFSTLEVSCDKLRKSRLFLKLLEAVLKTGNRMNDGTYRGGAQAFRLDTLLKLADVKGTDGKTTLLHFVVQEIIRSEGVRAVRTAKASQSHSSMKTEDFIEDTNEESEEHYRSLGLQVVSGLSSELEDVKKAAIIDGDALTAAVFKLNVLLKKAEDLLNNDLKNLEEDSEFQHSLASFVEKTKGEVSWLMEEEKRIMAQVKSAADYFHGNAGKDEGLRLFVIVRDFLIMLDKVCKEVKDTTMKTGKAFISKIEAPSMSSSPDKSHPSPSDVHRRLFPAIAERRMHDSSSDDDDDENLPT
ncbi:formin-like protein 3 [Gastrolobium bilobum]|uniref:formin-like protein 3 n=1 Tax=Gastrolobium bilobum TaxID=150636 RepID=UPI002AB279BB|nr:formin-like protein 3 [Gastrolobium bilobum]